MDGNTEGEPEPVRNEWTLACLCLILSVCMCSCASGLFSGRGWRETAQEEIDELVEKRRRAKKIYKKALKAQKADKKEELYLKVLQQQPSFGKVSNNLGVLYLKQNRTGEAIRYLRRAVKHLPGAPAPRFNLGLAYERAGRLQSAQEQYVSSMEMESSNPDYIEAVARIYIKRQVRLDQAEELLRKALSLEERSAHRKWIKEKLSELESEAGSSPGST